MMRNAAVGNEHASFRILATSPSGSLSYVLMPNDVTFEVKRKSLFVEIGPGFGL